jgi:hypothetical protein
MIVMGREKFLAPEILFQVLAAGQSKDDFERSAVI